MGSRDGSCDLAAGAGETSDIRDSQPSGGPDNLVDRWTTMAGFALPIGASPCTWPRPTTAPSGAVLFMTALHKVLQPYRRVIWILV